MRFFSTLLLASASLGALAIPARLNETDLNDLAALEFASTAEHFPLTELEKRSLEERAAASGVVTTCKTPGQIALTFDDGIYTYGHDIAATLTKNKVKGTFFVNVNNWACLYDNADELIARYKAGHVIGSHTGTHPDIATLTPAQLNKQLDIVETALQKILGVKPRLFRPPYGSVSQANMDVLKKRGYVVANWAYDSGDAASKAPAQTIKEYNALSVKKSYITLNHETHESTSKQVIPTVVPALIKKGFKLVDLGTCLGVSPYQSVGKAGKRDSTWTCKNVPAPGQT
ncbi:hypothetical protein JCM8097_002663 [Rhodosporidiobolus ruineniae]